MNCATIKKYILDAIVKYVGTQGLKRFRKYIVASVLKLSGPTGFVTGLILDYVIKKGWIVVEAKHEVNIKKEKYDKIINNPNSSAEDIANAFDDLFTH